MYAEEKEILKQHFESYQASWQSFCNTPAKEQL